MNKSNGGRKQLGGQEIIRGFKEAVVLRMARKV